MISQRLFWVLMLLWVGSVFAQSSSQLSSPLIKQIKFIGLKHTKEYIVQRELVHQVGELYKDSHWKKEKLRLRGLDVFSVVELDTSWKTDSLVLIYRFKELPPFIPLIGSKITDQEGWIVGPALAFLNLKGQDIRMEFQVRTSIPRWGRSTEGMFLLESPWLGAWPLEYSLFYQLMDSYNDLGNFSEKSHIGSVSLKYPVSHNLKGLFNTQLYTIEEPQDEARDVLVSTSGDRDWVPQIGGGLLLDTRESRVNPHRGLYLEGLGNVYGGLLGGSTNYMELLIDGRSFLAFGEKHILHTSLLIQNRWGKVGSYDKYYGGGSNSLRGFVAGDFIGDGEILTTLEYRYEWIGNKTFSFFGIHGFIGLQWVLGVDGGYFWEKQNWTKGEEGWGGYTGFHVLLPGLDRLRIELGSQITKVKWEFAVGLFEKSSTQRWRIR